MIRRLKDVSYQHPTPTFRQPLVDCGPAGLRAIGFDIAIVHGTNEYHWKEKMRSNFSNVPRGYMDHWHVLVEMSKVRPQESLHVLRADPIDLFLATLYGRANLFQQFRSLPFKRI
jgi:hypothetical protein